MKLIETLRYDIARGGYWAAAAMAVLRRAFGQKPVPLSLLRVIRSPVRNNNPLLPRDGISVLNASQIDDPKLGALFENRVYDEWALNHDSVNYLCRRFREIKAQSVLEFGSGVSTVVFSYLLGSDPQDRGRLLSIDQHREFAARTEAQLTQHGLQNRVRFEFPGMTSAEFHGASVDSYDLSPEFLSEIFKTIEPDVIFIDGPFGQGPVRGPVVPKILPYLKRPTTIILDDALRDNELGILSTWSTLPGVTVNGVVLIRNGMAEIAVTPRAR